jgi:D-cysteine desulfhydrase family pyridoxal phosphate-dependent enzyme
LFSKQLETYPRISLGQYPTPLELLPRLSKALRRPLYIKRDDMIGPVLGGNKTRKLEYLMAAAQRSRMGRVVTFGGLQSNHARLTAAVARQCGMEPHLFFFERRPAELTGNLILNDLLGAKMHFAPFGSAHSNRMTLERANRLVRVLAWVRVGPHYFIPVGGHSWRGCLGYVRAALELDEQARERGLRDAWVIVAAGTGGTLAGLMAGLALSNSPLRLMGIDVGKLWKAFPASIARLAADICARLGEPRAFSAANAPLIESVYAGQRYEAPSAEGMAAIKRLARLEGIILDPIYTGKAFAGLLDLVESGKLGRNEPVIFLHTGGTPAIFL